MKTLALGVLAVLICSTTFAARPASLICEHDGGVNVESGRPSPMYADIFAFEFDSVLDKVITDFEYADNQLFKVSPHSILIKLDYKDPMGNEYWWYEVNRHTGTLFVKRVVGNETYKAKGQCVLNGNRLF